MSRTREAHTGDGRRRGASWWLVRHRRWVVAAWLVAVAALAPLAAGVERVLDVGARVDGSESWQVDEMLRRRFDSPFAHYVVLVVTGLVGDAADDRNAALLREIVGTVRAVPGVTGTLALTDQLDRAPLPAQSGGTFILV